MRRSAAGATIARWYAETSAFVTSTTVPMTRPFGYSERSSFPIPRPAVTTTSPGLTGSLWRIHSITSVSPYWPRTMPLARDVWTSAETLDDESVTRRIFA